MKLIGLDQELVKQQAQIHFKKYIEVMELDLFIKNIEKATCMMDGYEQKLYISTHYAYHDVDVNGNITRYKVPITCILIKEHAYEVVYNSVGKLYVAYMEEDEMKFMLYESFLDHVANMIHVVDEIKTI